MLPHGEPAFDGFKAFAAEFGQLDELLILVDGPRPAREAVAETLTARLAALPSMRSVQGRLDAAGAADALLGAYLFNYIPLDAYDEVRQRLPPAGVAAQVAANKALLATPFDVSLARTVAADPLGLRRFAGRQLAAAAGGVLPDLDGGWLTARDGGALMADVQAAAAALIIGARRVDDQLVRPIKLFGNRFANRWVEIACGCALPDTQSGFRIYPLPDTLWLGARAERFAFETEVLICAARVGMEIRSVPVAVYYPPPGERVSHYRPWRDTLRIIAVVVGLILRR